MVSKEAAEVISYRYEYGIFMYERAKKLILERDQKVQEAIQKGFFKNKKMKTIDDKIIQEIRHTTDDLLNLINYIIEHVCSPKEFEHLRRSAIGANKHLSILINDNFPKYVNKYGAISEILRLFRAPDRKL